MKTLAKLTIEEVSKLELRSTKQKWMVLGFDLNADPEPLCFTAFRRLNFAREAANALINLGINPNAIWEDVPAGPEACDDGSIGDLEILLNP